MKMTLHPSPLAAWLLLATAVTTLFPLKLEHVITMLIAAALLSVIWLPGRRMRSAPFVVLYALTAVLALTVPLPLPGNWHPLVRLLLTLGAWGLVLALPLAGLLAYLLRTAAELNRPR